VAGVSGARLANRVIFCYHENAHLGRDGGKDAMPQGDGIEEVPKLMEPPKREDNMDRRSKETTDTTISRKGLTRVRPATYRPCAEESGGAETRTVG
jgi:hypothetical protein